MNYRNEINGLRALAIIPVIFFHLDFKIFKNGFLGVDIFFVISGYLITTLIIKELINKNFSVKFFLEKRARRILPALYFLMIVTLPLAWIFLSRNELSSYLKSLTAIIFFLSNYFFWNEIPYFASDASFKPLLHTWSLSIEAQFYICTSFLLIFIYKLNKLLIIYVLQVFFILSLLLFFWLSVKAPNVGFYFTFSRIWELCIGGIVAYLIINNRFNLTKLFNDILSLFGLSLILCCFFFLNYYSKTLLILLSTVGSCLIIIFANKKSLVGKFLSNKIFVIIGVISYSLYLWHFTIIAFAKNYYGEINLQLKFLIIIFSFFLSIFSYKFIEKPFRNFSLVTTQNFYKLIIWATLFLVFFSFLTFNYFEAKGGNESLLAKSLAQNKIIISHRMDERIFVKYRIIYENYNPEILVIGSSRIRELAEKEMNKKTLNLSVGGASIEDQLVIAEMALEKFNPNTIYLAADPWLFNEYSVKKEWKSLKPEYNKTLSNINSWSTEKIINFNKQKLVDGNEKINLTTSRENILEKIYSIINLNPNLDNKENIKNKTYKTIILRDGKRVYGLEYQNQEITNEILRHSSMDNYKFSTSRFENYSNFLSYLKIYHKKEVILVLSPYYNPSFELTIKEIPMYLEIEKKFINLAHKNQVKILGSYDSKLLNCENNEFYDSYHPKSSCMKKAIKKIN